MGSGGTRGNPPSPAVRQGSGRIEASAAPRRWFEWWRDSHKKDSELSGAAAAHL